MAVILSDAEAANVAQILRRMNERVEDVEDHTVAYVDDRSPTDFANQLEALAGSGPENVYVPMGVNVNGDPQTGPAFVTRTAADQFGAGAGLEVTHKIPLRKSNPAADGELDE